MANKYIQCYYQYPVTFSSIGKTFPAAKAVGEMRNLAEVTEKEFEKLMNCEPFFRELVNNKKYRVLNKMPEGYKPSAQRINEANDEIARLKAENEKLKAQNAASEKNELKTFDEEVEPVEELTKEEVIDGLKKAPYEELQNIAKNFGIDPKQKKAVLLEDVTKAILKSKGLE